MFLEGILQISDLKNVLGQTMNMEAMEQKLENLEATVKSREDEIKKVYNKITCGIKILLFDNS